VTYPLAAAKHLVSLDGNDILPMLQDLKFLASKEQTKLFLKGPSKQNFTGNFTVTSWIRIKEHQNHLKMKDHMLSSYEVT
jgi:hypothetical protein